MAGSQCGSATIAQVDGWPINIANQDQAVEAICSAAQRGESFATFTLNLDHIAKLRHDTSFREAYAKARFVTADGAPVARLASRNGTTVLRTTGADLVEPLVEEAAGRGLPIYLCGSSPEVLTEARTRLSALTGHRLDVVGATSPQLGFDPTGSIADAELDRIVASGARLCFLALGSPKQEILAARAVEKGIPVGFICVGAALDFLVGHQARAPKFMQDKGLEWLWRVTINPRRLAPRYASCALVLADLLIWRPFKLRLSRLSG